MRGLPLALAIVGWLVVIITADASDVAPAPSETDPPTIEIPEAAEPTREPAAPQQPGDLGMRGGGGFRVPGFQAIWYPTSGIENQPGDFTLFRQSLNLGLPVWRGERGTLIASTNLRSTLADTDAILPDTGRAFPNDLWSINLGLSYMHRYDNGWSGGLITSVGSSSDLPFDSIREMDVSLISFLRVPARRERDAWVFSLMYSPVGNLNFPIPGIAYVWHPTDEFRMQIGLPFSVMYRPIEPLTFEFNYVPLTNIVARTTYRWSDRLASFAGYEFFNEAYFLSDRVDRRDRFMGFEQRLLAGTRWNFWPRAALEGTAGYAFERWFAEGRNQGGNLRDRVNIESGAFVAGALRIMF